MKDNAELSEKNTELEHMIEQLQFESGTIGEIFLFFFYLNKLTLLVSKFLMFFF